MVIGSNILAGASGQGGYEIDQSIRFNDDDSAYLTRTPGSEGNRRTFTFSTWVKFATLKADTILFSSWVSSGASSYQILVIDSDFRMRVADHSTNYLITSQKFRDVGSWYSVVWRADTTDSTSGDRYQLFINGSRVTAFDTESQPSLNFQGSVNQTQPHYLGRNGYNLAMVYSDLYQAETHFVDGTALDCNSFGEFDSDTGQWIPKQYAGSYGSQGFYIKGQDSSALGDDSSGNNNDFSANGLSSADSVLDSPSDNFAVLNPLANYNSCTFSNGNLQLTAGDSSQDSVIVSTMPMLGKTYFEWTVQGGSSQYPTVGIIQESEIFADGSSDKLGETTNPTSIGQERDGTVDRNNSVLQTYTAFSDGDVGMCAYDPETRKVWFGREGTFNGDPAAGSGEAATMAGTDDVFAAISIFSSNGANSSLNFGQLGFEYTPPTGYKALSTGSIPAPTIANPAEYFDSKLWAGNSTDGRAITGYNFAPSWVWIKARNNAYSHNITDAVRGAGNFMLANAADAEVNGPDVFGSTLAFTSDGFTLDNGTTSNLYVNETGTNYVGWAWKANGSGSSNTAGSINTTATSANTTAGFSISTFTGNGTSGATFGHGLGVAPKMVIVKERSPGGNNWKVGHDAMGFGKYIALDTNAAQVTDSAHWNDTAPSSTVVTLGNDTGINQNTATYVAYCFAEVPGYSAIGSYTGSGSAGDGGTFIHTGFTPAWVMLKRYDSAGEWQVSDRVRDPDNPVRLILQPNSSAVEWDATTRDIDWLSNGFKHRSAHADFNASGGNYLYLAFAESPFKTSNAR